VTNDSAPRLGNTFPGDTGAKEKEKYKEKEKGVHKKKHIWKNTKKRQGCGGLELRIQAVPNIVIQLHG